MTAGTNGGGTPENDDPFAYLYRQEGGGSATDDGATAQQPQYGQPGVPRTSYNQVTRVGQTNYGQRAQQGGYGYPPQQAPAQQPGTVPGQQGQGQYGHGRPDPAPAGRAAARRDGGGGGRDNRGLLIGAVAVVAAVAVGIGVAVWAGSDKDPSAKGPGASSSAEPGDGKPRPKPTKKPPAQELPPVTDAASLELTGGAKKSTEHAGAFGEGGEYVDGMQTPGATVTWKVSVPEAGEYRFNVRYANAGDDTEATILVNGKSQKINLGNFAKQDDWAKAWTRSWGAVKLDKGENVIDLTCGGGEVCAFNVDQVSITRSGYPSTWP